MKRGFSLVELSVVLVVIGLLIGGIIAGKSLIAGGELKDIQRQALAIQGAYTSFRDQYGYYPGDYPNAESVWGSDPGGCPGNLTTTLRATTCNGNGDGKVLGNEATHAIQQLADAGMITGMYTGGLATTLGNGVFAGLNVLQTKRKGVGIWITYQATTSGFTNTLEGNLMNIGGSSSGFSYLVNAGLTVTEAFAFDTKFDDGLPQSGKIMPIYNNASNPNCSAAGNTAYALTNGDTLDISVKTAGCQLWWKWD